MSDLVDERQLAQRVAVVLGAAHRVGHFDEALLAGVLLGRLRLDRDLVLSLLDHDLAGGQDRRRHQRTLLGWKCHCQVCG